MTKKELEQQLNELKEMINKLPSDKECNEMSLQVIGEESIAFSYGYLLQAVVILKEIVKGA